MRALEALKISVEAQPFCKEQRKKDLLAVVEKAAQGGHFVTTADVSHSHSQEATDALTELGYKVTRVSEVHSKTRLQIDWSMSK